jgi:hypothetical protein
LTDADRNQFLTITHKEQLNQVDIAQQHLRQKTCIWMRANANHMMNDLQGVPIATLQNQAAQGAYSQTGLHPQTVPALHPQTVPAIQINEYFENIWINS